MRRLVRGADAEPLVTSLAQRASRTVPVLLRELDPPARDVCDRVERRGAAAAYLVRVDDPVDLVRRRASRLQVVRRDGDLHERGEHAEPQHGGFHLVESVPDAGERAVHLALRQSQEAEPGLHRASPFVRRPVRLLRAREVTAAASDLGDLVVPGRRDVAFEISQLLAGRDRLLLRRGPVTAQAHDLRPVDPARAGEAGHVGLVAPAVRRVGPLGGAPIVAEVVARADGDAVDEAGRERLELAAHGRRTRLVVEREPLLDVTAHHERASLPGEGEHLQVAVADALAELVRLAEELDRLREVALVHQRREPLGQRWLVRARRTPEDRREAVGPSRTTPAPRRKRRDPRDPTTASGRFGRRRACRLKRSSERRHAPGARSPPRACRTTTRRRRTARGPRRRARCGRRPSRPRERRATPDARRRRGLHRESRLPET